MLRESIEQAPEQTAAFLTDMINDDVIFKSEALRSEGSKFEYELSGVLYRSGDRNSLSGFFDQWEPAKDWLYDNTSLDQRMDIVYTSNPNAEIQSFITATMSNDVLERVIGGLPEITALDYVEKLVLSFPTQAQSITSLLGAATDTMTLAEHHIYGSSRLGIQTYDTTYRNTYNVDPNVTPLARLSANRTWYSGTSGDFVGYTSKTPWAAIDNSAFRESRTVGKRYYEMTDHLGNVLATVMDRKTGHLPQGGGIGSLYDYWQADLASVQDYYPGGMLMPGRYKEMNGDTTLYRFGYGTQMRTDEVAGYGNWYTALYWEYGPRELIRKNPDPITNPSVSPYAVLLGNPIFYNDPNGDCVGKGCESMTNNGNMKYSQTDKAKSAEMEDFVVTPRNGLISSTAKPTRNTSSGLFGGSGSMNLLQAAAKDIGRNDEMRRQADMAHQAAFAWMLFGAAPFAGIAAVESAPVWIPLFATSTEFAATKATLSWTSQALINGVSEVDYADVAGDAFTAPGLSALIGGGVDFKPFAERNQFRIQGMYNSKSTTEFLIDAGVSFGTGWLGEKMSIGLRPKLKTANERRIFDLGLSISQQALNKKITDATK